MAAKSKAELLAVTLKDYDKLESLISDLPDHQALVKDVDGASIKDIIGHRAHWISLFLGWYADGLAGKRVEFPAPGYKWNELKAYNSELRRSQSGLSWEQVRQLLSDNHARLTGFISSHSDEDLYAAPMKGANNNWVPGRWAEAAGPSHYRSAAKYIRQTLKSR